MFRYIAEKVKSKSRRSSVIEAIDTREIQSEIQFQITFLKKTGQKHFTLTDIRQRVNEETGFPVLSDEDSLELFLKLFKTEVSKYQPSLKGRNAFSFQLKPSSSKMITTKVLR